MDTRTTGCRMQAVGRSGEQGWAWYGPPSVRGPGAPDLVLCTRAGGAAPLPGSAVITQRHKPALCTGPQPHGPLSFLQMHDDVQ